MELRQYFQLLRKHILLIALVCLAGAGAALYYSLRQPPVYKASATLALNPSAPNSAVPFSPSSQVQDLIPTYNAYVKTRAFAGLVAQDVSLPGVDADTILRAITSEGIPNTLFFRVNATSSNAQYAQLFANSVAHVFIEQNVAQQREQLAQLGDVQQAERQQLDESRKSLQDEVDYYRSVIPSLRKQIDDLEVLPPSTERDRRILDLRNQLSQSQDLNTKLLATLTDVKSKLSQLASTSALNTAIVVDQARLPPAPQPSDLPRNVLAALFASFVLSFGGILLLEQIDYTFKTPEEMDGQYGMTTLGVMGVLESRESKTPGERLVALVRPQSTSAEAFRTLRTNVRFAATKRPIHSLLITSAGPSEGKSFTAANLAIVYAQLGQRVILVDLDLRRPSVHRLFSVPNKKGFTNLMLDENLSVEAHLAETPVPGLQVLPSGPLPPNPSELLSSPRAQQLITQLTEHADLVIFDSPPAVTVADAVILSTIMDATIQVVMAGTTRRDVVLRGRDLLVRAEGRLLGPVMNKMRFGDAGYYYYYYRYYNTGYSASQPPSVQRTLRGFLRRSRNGHEKSEAVTEEQSN